MADVGTSLSPEDADRLRAFERRRHDGMAASYHGFFTPVTGLAIAPLLDAVKLVPGIDLLDVATGPGSVAGAAGQRGARVVGVDLSPGMIDLARRSFSGIDFRVADVEHLPFEARAFDAVVCNFGVGHFPYPELAVAECARTLKGGGRVALSWWDDPARARIQGLFREAIAEVGAAPSPDVPKGHSTQRFNDTEEFRGLLAGAGLADVVVDEHQATFLVGDVETLWRGGLGSLAVTASAITHQDAATQRAIRSALERRAAAYRTADGLRLPIAFKVAAGRKPQ